MLKRPRIVVFGSLNYDNVILADRLPKKGESIIGTKFQTFIGGKGANQAVQAARLGAEVYMIGRVGNDYMGDAILKSLAADGVNTEHVKRDSKYGTGTCSIMVDKNGDNYLIVAPQANAACTPDDLNETLALIKSADIFMTQNETNIPVTEYALKLAHEHQVKTIYNPAPARTVTEEVFRYADIVTPNETEAEAYTGIKEEGSLEDWCNRTADAFARMGTRTLVITLGKNGAFICNEHTRTIIPTYTDVKAVDATAAGDAFNGAMAVGLAEGMDILQAIRFANGAGTLAASREGAQSSLATRKELENFLKGRIE